MSAEANLARAEGEWGAEVGAAYSLPLLPGFTLRPGGGVFVYERENDRYFIDRFDDGDGRCRDITNGQFADSDLCGNTSVSAYARLEGTYTLLGTTEVGIGGRLSGDGLRPYATASFPVLPRVRVKANGGDRYFALGLRADF
ncbi:hypothetical protein AAV99_13100 [Aurantiacibacter marinus]|uniref:Uncharacterized protein n=1 Tax=Aurantiacibacter marinus TaxID=874156 RepID=A0A0H0XM74_9SPHN|nr:hypothetical protein AAV99_13100 [Aurantiacibacter marinus]